MVMTLLKLKRVQRFNIHQTYHISLENSTQTKTDGKSTVGMILNGTISSLTAKSEELDETPFL
jgi:hypothetical protein